MEEGTEELIECRNCGELVEEDRFCEHYGVCHKCEDQINLALDEFY